LSRAKALQQPLDLGAGAGLPHGDDVKGADFVAAALAARRALSLQRAASAALQAAAPLLDDRAARRWREDLVVGDASWSPALTALASAACDGDGRASATPSSASLAVAAIDVELARDTKALRAALQRLPSSLTTEAAALQFRRAVEAAWVARCLAGRDAAVVELPLVDEPSLHRLRRVHQLGAKVSHPNRAALEVGMRSAPTQLGLYLLYSLRAGRRCRGSKQCGQQLLPLTYLPIDVTAKERVLHRK
jgi:hypothetical protein